MPSGTTTSFEYTKAGALAKVTIRWGWSPRTARQRQLRGAPPRGGHPPDGETRSRTYAANGRIASETNEAEA